MLDGHRDELLEALLPLLSDAMTSELSVESDLACQSTHAWPITPARLKVAELPALAVWRQREAYAPRMTGAHDARVTLRLLYVMPPTPLDSIGPRWPMLTASWAIASATLLAGHHEAHRDDAEVLRDVGVIDVDLTATQVDYSTPPSDADVMPQWEATVVVTVRPTSDTSSLADLSLSTELHPEDLPEDERPLVEELHTQ